MFNFFLLPLAISHNVTQSFEDEIEREASSN